jgi:hypothetical protein
MVMESVEVEIRDVISRAVIDFLETLDFDGNDPTAR